jgi:Tfp pilus assembly protein PilZ
MRPPILIVARQSATMLGLAQAILKFGHQLVTAYPEPIEVERAERLGPSMVVVRPPAEAEQRKRCCELIKARFKDRGIPVIFCVATPEEEQEVRSLLGSVAFLVGSPLKLNDLYLRMNEMFDLARRRELRIRAELVVAHREPGGLATDHYNYDTMRSLSLGGCFIETATPYPIGNGIEVAFCVGAGSRSLNVKGKVIRVGKGDYGNATGMGIKFDPLGDTERSMLESFLMSHLGTLDLPAAL